MNSIFHDMIVINVIVNVSFLLGVTIWQKNVQTVDGMMAKTV